MNAEPVIAVLINAGPLTAAPVGQLPIGPIPAARCAPEGNLEWQLRVWRERWHHASSAQARAHAQQAIDHWLDRLLTTGSDRDLTMSAREVLIVLPD
jgi:hypothetical protein